jgi:hypothetical protein
LLKKKLVNKETGITLYKIKMALQAPEFAEYKNVSQASPKDKKAAANSAEEFTATDQNTKRYLLQQ